MLYVNNKRKRAASRYFKRCKYCDENFYTTAKFGKVCDDCTEKHKKNLLIKLKELKKEREKGLKK